jgi:CRP/FNR family transcriptional regulator, dissimilatory nitrate respiration regulator
MTANLDTIHWKAIAEQFAAVAHVPAALRESASLVTCEATETIFRIGDPVRRAMLVLNGEVRLIRRDLHGREVILQRSTGGFIAEASLDSRVYHCDALAAEASTLLVFPAKAFVAALDEDAAFRRAWQSLLAKEVRKLRSQCERLNLNSAADRILHYIEAEGSNGSLSLTQTKKAWAAELGLTHEALYRTLRRMQDEGEIRVDGLQWSVRSK